MAARDYLSGLQFQHLDVNPLTKKVVAVHPELGEVGHITWAKTEFPRGGHNIKTGEITHIEVGADNPRLRKKGIGRALYDEAARIGPQPLHSTNLSNSGRKFAHGVGGPWA